MKEPRLEINVAGERVIVDLDKCTQQKVDDLYEKVVDIRSKHSIYAKYPFEASETREQWAERVSKESQGEILRKDNESAEEHLKRMFDAKSEISLIVPEIFNAVCEVFDQKTFDTKELKQVNWLKLKRFLADVLMACDVPGAEDLRPVTPGK